MVDFSQAKSMRGSEASPRRGLIVVDGVLGRMVVVVVVVVGVKVKVMILISILYTSSFTGQFTSQFAWSCTDGISYNTSLPQGVYNLLLAL